MNILFVCSQNKLRSPTAENIFSEYPNLNCRSAGLNNDAVVKITPEDIEWANIIFLMEQIHKNKLLKHYRKYINTQKLVVLSISDRYNYMDQKLIDILTQTIKKYI